MVDDHDSNALDALLEHPALWRARQTGSRAAVPETIATGCRALDGALRGGGWPRAGLTELLADTAGIGELRLLAPALARLSRDEERWLAWINPPHVPYAPALERFGIRTDRVLLVWPGSHQDALWATEQALTTGTCSAVLIWPVRGPSHGETRRLGLACRNGRTLGLLFRAAADARHASAAELRLLLAATGNPDRLRIEILKRRGGWALDLDDVTLPNANAAATRATLIRQLERWRQRHGVVRGRADTERRLEGPAAEH